MVTITLKNIPDSLHAKLKKLAKAHRRSLNGEILARLEQGQAEVRVLDSDVLRRVRALRKNIKGVLTNKQIQKYKDEGRP